jgi:hypothetical protein
MNINNASDDFHRLARAHATSALAFGLLDLERSSLAMSKDGTTKQELIQFARQEENDEVRAAIVEELSLPAVTVPLNSLPGK